MTGNDRQKTPLTGRQLRAIAALCEEPTTRAAAKKARISEKTLWRWLNDATFAEAYRAARGRLLEDVLTSLQSASMEAVDVLRQVMTDKGVNPFARVAAARGVLELSLRAREILELDERLKALEISNSQQKIRSTK